uniref:HMG box domain-containing protein n=1 Tax=Mycena chlorophos TaxID=658473 RepID=A0ABQ0L1T5_MYCCL|nr:predicted protein [Mycena chlorophos]
MTPQDRSATSFAASSRSQRSVGHVRRPRNAFIIFRSTALQRCEGKGPPQALQSQAIAEVWRNMSEDERAPYRDAAEREKIAHEEQYPFYQYIRHRRRPPQRKRNTQFNTPENQARKKELVATIQGRHAISDESLSESEDDEQTAAFAPQASWYPIMTANDVQMDPASFTSSMDVSVLDCSESPHYLETILATSDFEAAPFVSDLSLAQILADDFQDDSSAYFGDTMASMADGIPWGNQIFKGVQFLSDRISEERASWQR